MRYKENIHDVVPNLLKIKGLASGNNGLFGYLFTQIDSKIASEIHRLFIKLVQVGRAQIASVPEENGGLMDRSIHLDGLSSLVFPVVPQIDPHSPEGRYTSI